MKKTKQVLFAVLLSLLVSGCIHQKELEELPVKDNQLKVETGSNVKNEENIPVPEKEEITNYMDIRNDIDFFMYSTVDNEIKYYGFDMDNDKKYLIYKSNFSLIQPLSDGTWLAYSDGDKKGYINQGKKLWLINLVDENKNEIVVNVSDDENLDFINDVLIGFDKNILYYKVTKKESNQYEREISELNSYNFETKTKQKIFDLDPKLNWTKYNLIGQQDDILILGEDSGEGGVRIKRINEFDLNKETVNRLISYETSYNLLGREHDEWVLSISPNSFNHIVNIRNFNQQTNFIEYKLVLYDKYQKIKKVLDEKTDIYNNNDNIIAYYYDTVLWDGEILYYVENNINDTNDKLVIKNTDTDQIITIENIDCKTNCNLLNVNILTKGAIIQTNGDKIKDKNYYWSDFKNKTLTEIKNPESNFLTHKN